MEVSKGPFPQHLLIFLAGFCSLCIVEVSCLSSLLCLMLYSRFRLANEVTGLQRAKADPLLSWAHQKRFCLSLNEIEQK